MLRRFTLALSALALAAMAAGCHHNKVNNPIANVDSKQPDKVLFDRAMDAVKHGKYDVSRLTFQTLINTYPDSEFVGRAKLGIADSWYAEGGTAAYQQAEAEYRDFQTFFPNMSQEAAEAQLKIATIHYKQMEKADRDFTHAKRAEDEYRLLLTQYPDSKLVPEAKQRLREVQEVLADREFMIGRFYWLRESFPAAEARLKTMTDTYPLYSRADEALMMLGQAYESQIETVKRIKGLEKSKAPLIKSYTDSAAAAYARLIERYPISDRAANARDHLKALDRPVPTPSAEAIAEAKAEEASRNELGRFGKIMSPLRKRPDTSLAAKVGEPAIADVEATSAPQIVRHSTNLAMGIPDSGNVSVEAVKSGTPGASQPPPRTEAAPPGEAQPAGEPKGDSTAIPELVVNGPGSKPPAASTPPSSAAPGAPAANQGSTSDGSGPAAGATANPPANGNADAKAQDQGKKDQTDSSSKKKKKKKLIIF